VFGYNVMLMIIYIHLLNGIGVIKISKIHHLNFDVHENRGKQQQIDIETITRWHTS
jgi:hypothetical protein